MLRRKFILAASGGFRYLVSKVKMVFKHWSSLGTGVGTDIESKLDTHYTHSADISSREAGDLLSKQKTYTDLKSEASSGTGALVESKRKTKTKLKSGLVSYLVRELWHRVKSIIKITSNLESVDSASIDSRVEQFTQLKSDIIPADSSVSASTLLTGQLMVSELDKGIGADTVVNLETGTQIRTACTYAPGEIIVSGISTQTNLSSDLKTWTYPAYDKDGVLVIKQVHYANLNNGVLEVN